jgi:hypothetical protein
MSLNKATLDDLQAELERLHVLKGKIDQRVTAIEAILTPFDFGQVTLPFQSPAGGPNGKGATPSNLHLPPPQTVAQVAAGLGAVGTGLRAAILQVVREKGPIRAKAVSRILEARGLTFEGSSTPLPVRVYNDLWRMSEKGLLEKKDGVFSVK